jgi:hypothetical protein
MDYLSKFSRSTKKLDVEEWQSSTKFIIKNWNALTAESRTLYLQEYRSRYKKEIEIKPRECQSSQSSLSRRHFFSSSGNKRTQNIQTCIKTINKINASL